MALLKSLRPAAMALIAQLALDGDQIKAISIAGESGSGKTTLSNLLIDLLKEKGFKPLMLHQDDYFKLPPKMNHEFRLKDFSSIGPQEIRLKLLDNHIWTVKNKTETILNVPCMNWITDTEETKQVPIADVNVILVDGTYTSLLNQLDYRILINTNYEDTRQNRIKRNRER
jgi:uridine kinase